MGGSRLLVLAGAFLAALALAGTAAAGNAGFAPPDSATSSGSAINELYWVVIGISAAIFLLVESALIWFIFRYRRRPQADAGSEGPQIHGNTRLEIVWTAIPVLIVGGILAVTLIKVPAVNSEPGPGEEPLVIQVAGHQFYWEYTYPDGVVQVDELRLPVGQPVRLELTSPDVVHSWWVPELTGKRDAIPGRTNTLNFTVRRPGTFEGQCAEFCGVEHAVMRTVVRAVPAAEFDTWLAQTEQAQAEGTSNLGEQTWAGACAKCHGLDGQGGYGPQIAGNSTLSDRDLLAQLLAEGQDNEGVPGHMPAISQGWPEKQLDALIGYLVASGLAPEPAEEG